MIVESSLGSSELLLERKMFKILHLHSEQFKVRQVPVF